MQEFTEIKRKVHPCRRGSRTYRASSLATPSRGGVVGVGGCAYFSRSWMKRCFLGPSALGKISRLEKEGCFLSWIIDCGSMHDIEMPRMCAVLRNLCVAHRSPSWKIHCIAILSSVQPTPCHVCIVLPATPVGVRCFRFMVSDWGIRVGDTLYPYTYVCGCLIHIVLRIVTI